MEAEWGAGGLVVKEKGARIDYFLAPNILQRRLMALR